jgi:putative FmdB family regulatory protein
MPTYDYQCDACEHSFEEFQSFSEKPLKKCPKCGKLKLRRLLGTGAAILFKGSGFYQTDYRSDSYKQAAKAEDSAKNGTKDTGKTSESNGTTGASGAKGAKPAAKSPKSKS